MRISKDIQHLFVRALHLWVAGFVLACLSQVEDIWIEPVSPALVFPSGPVKFLVELAGYLPDSAWYLIIAGVLSLALYSLIRGPSVLGSILIWAGYVVLIARGWMISTGGHQLIAIMLLLSIPISTSALRFTGVANTAAWAARMQLVLAYLSTFLHKLQGNDWVNGKALTILSSDPTFHYDWFADKTLVAAGSTYAGLLFQAFFALGIWFRSSRAWAIGLGVVFHLVNAVAIEIPDMSLAFILSYSIWLPKVFLEKTRAIIDVTLSTYIPLLRR